MMGKKIKIQTLLPLPFLLLLSPRKIQTQTILPLAAENSRSTLSLLSSLPNSLQLLLCKLPPPLLLFHAAFCKSCASTSHCHGLLLSAPLLKLVAPSPPCWNRILLLPWKRKTTSALLPFPAVKHLLSADCKTKISYCCRPLAFVAAFCFVDAALLLSPNCCRNSPLQKSMATPLLCYKMQTLHSSLHLQIIASSSPTALPSPLFANRNQPPQLMAVTSPLLQTEPLSFAKIPTMAEPSSSPSLP